MSLGWYKEKILLNDKDSAKMVKSYKEHKGLDNDEP